MYLFVVVSQWHGDLVVRCHDFFGCETRDAPRPSLEDDAAILQDFRVGCECIVPRMNTYVVHPVKPRYAYIGKQMVHGQNHYDVYMLY